MNVFKNLFIFVSEHSLTIRMINQITNRQVEIIQAASKILTKSGISGLTIKNLSKEMQFSESAIYRHFSSKEEIIFTMLKYLTHILDERYTLALANDLSPKEKFIALFQNLISFFNTNPHFVVVVFSDGLMEKSKKINETILKVMEIQKNHLHPIIIDGQEQHVFTNSLAAEDLLQIIIGTMRLQMFNWRASNFEFDMVQKGNKMIKSLLTLIEEK